MLITCSILSYIVNVDDFGILSLMRVLAAGIDVEVAVEGVTQSVLGKHTTDGMFKNTLGMSCQHFGGCCLTLSSGISGIMLINLVSHLFAGEDNLLGVDDDNVVAAINVRSVTRLCFASQDVGYASGETANGLVFCIDQYPLFLYSIFIGRYGFVT